MQNSEGSGGALKAEATGTEGVGLRRLQGLGTTAGRGPETQRRGEGMDGGEKAQGGDTHAASGDRVGGPLMGGSPWLCWEPEGSSSDGKSQGQRPATLGEAGVQSCSVATGQPVMVPEQRKGVVSIGPLHCGLAPSLGSLCLYTRTS